MKRNLDLDDVLLSKGILIVSKPLWESIGLGESIVLRQVAWLCDMKSTDKKYAQETHFHDDRWWVYNTYEDWRKDHFPGWSVPTIRRYLNNLESLGLLLTGNFNRWSMDQTKWYAPDKEAIRAFLDLWQEHGCPIASGGKSSPEYQQFLNAWETLRQQKIDELPIDQLDHMGESPIDQSDHMAIDQSDQILGDQSDQPNTQREPEETTEEKIRDADSVVTSADDHYGDMDPQKYAASIRNTPKASPEDGASRYASIQWRALEEAIIQAVHATSQGLSDNMRRQLAAERPYKMIDGETKYTPPLIDLFDESQDFRRFVQWRIEMSVKDKSRRVSRSTLVSDICNILRPGTGWIDWRRKNGTEPEAVEVITNTQQTYAANWEDELDE